MICLKIQDKKKFNILYREWDDLVLKSGFKPTTGAGPARNQKSMKLKSANILAQNKISNRRADLYLPYSKIIKNLKKVIIRNIFESANKSMTNLENINPLLLNEFLYTLDFNVTLKVNESRQVDITNITKTLSPFKNLMDITQDSSNNQRVVLLIS